MAVSSKVFFNSLSVDTKHFIKVFKRIGVKSSFIFDYDDLKLISNEIKPVRYKSALVVKRANDLLGDLHE